VDEEFLLTILYMAAGIGAVLYLVYLVWFMQTAETFRDAPVMSACAWLSMVGALLFFGSMVTMGQLSFEIPTGWGVIRSDVAGVLLAATSLAARAWFAARKRRRRLSPGS
jgi:hypothetical protein